MDGEICINRSFIIFFITRHYSGDQRMRWVDYAALMKSETHINLHSKTLKRRDIEIGTIMILKWITMD